jgi:superfamily I DNA and/or RNA helicase
MRVNLTLFLVAYRLPFRLEYSSGYTAPILLLQGQSYSFLQVHGRERQSRSGSFENELEAQAVVELVEQLQRASCRAPGNWQSVDRIRIITFYQAQVHLIKRLLRNRRGLGDIVVATVDSSQGCEADIVIVSFVRSNTGRPEKSSVGFLSDDRRLNVALTRGKKSSVDIL